MQNLQNLQIEGKESSKDFSYAWVQGHNDLVTIERGVSIVHFSEELGKRDLEMEFRLLRRLTETQHHNDNLFDFHPDLLRLNRYNNILPFKHSIVKLKTDGEDEDNHKETYINANFINLINSKEKMIIATQGPLAHTIAHFWKMIVQENVSMIIMLCNLRENQRVQCEQYWPKEGETNIWGIFSVKLESQKDFGNNLIERKLVVQKGGKEEWRVTQLQWLGWADQGVPSSQDFDVIMQMLHIIVDTLEKDQRIVFHCSAGVGRTGTLISLTNLMIILRTYKQHIGNDVKKIEENPDLYRVSVFGTVRRLREQRWGMVHTSEQYQYVYKFIEEAIRQMFSN